MSLWGKYNINVPIKMKTKTTTTLKPFELTIIKNGSTIGFMFKAKSWELLETDPNEIKHAIMQRIKDLKILLTSLKEAASE